MSKIDQLPSSFSELLKKNDEYFDFDEEDEEEDEDEETLTKFLRRMRQKRKKNGRKTTMD